MPRTLEYQPVLIPSVTVSDPHHLVTARARLLLIQEPLSDHPLETPLELASDPEHLKIPLKAQFDHVSLDHLLHIHCFLLATHQLTH